MYWNAFASTLKSLPLSATAAGRLMYEKHDFYSSALRLVKDEVENVRHAALIAIERVSLSPIGKSDLLCSVSLK